MSAELLITAIAAVLAVPGFYLAFKQLVQLPEEERRQILNALKPTVFIPPGLSIIEQAKFLIEHGLDWHEFGKSVAMSHAHFTRGVRKLVEEEKIDVYLAKGVTNDANEEPTVLPVFFRAGLDPRFKATTREAIILLNTYQRRGK